MSRGGVGAGPSTAAANGAAGSPSRPLGPNRSSPGHASERPLAARGLGPALLGVLDYLKASRASCYCA
jgi:hypothetical protein